MYLVSKVSPRNSKLDSPEIQIGSDKFHSQIPTVRPQHALMDDHRFRRLPRGQVGHAQPLLQIEFTRAYQQTAVIVHHSSEASFKMQGTCLAVPLDRHWHARIHSRSAA